MNRAQITGRLTRDPEMRTTTSQIAVCSFTVAVDRRFKNASGEREADFIPVVAWRQTAEFVLKYFRKGSRIEVCGSIQTRSWEADDGTRRYATEIIADEVGFGDSKNGSGATNTEPAQTTTENSNLPFPLPDDDTSLPFDL